MNNFMQKLYNFMYGRYGVDKLTIFLILINLLLNGIGSFMRNIIVYYGFRVLALAVLFFAVYRVFSRNIAKRSREGEWFDSILIRTNYTDKIGKTKRWFKRQKLKFKYRKTHRFRVCPNCGENLRFSKKRGKRDVNCPICGNRFSIHIFF